MSRTKIRFSLRSLLTFLTVATIFLGYRNNQRRTLQQVAECVQSCGGSVFYRWQKPYPVKVPTHVPNAYWTVDVPFEETLPDGTKVVKMWTEIAHQNRGFAVSADDFRTKNKTPPGFALAAFLTGSHDDVDIEAVTIPATSVTKAIANELSRLPSLKSIILLVDQRYYAVAESRRRTPAQKKEELHQLEKPLKLAVELIQNKLPDVNLHEQGVLTEGD